ncbi:MAG: molybdopterin-containing oxidoreductase family protein [Anaerolineae bacterium]
MTIREVPVSCNKDCGGGCPLWAKVVDGRVESIRTSPYAGPYMRGCVRGFQAARILYAPDRLITPLLRTGQRGSNQFKPISWDEALDRIATALGDVYQRFGPTSVMNFGGYGSGQGCLHNTNRTTSRFLSLLGGYTYLTGGYSRCAGEFATPYVLGTDANYGLDPGSLEDSNLIVLLGSNVFETRFGCEWEERLLEACKRGTPIIAIDPRRSTTIAALDAEWLPINPGTDAALILALLYVLISERLVDVADIGRYAVGYEALRERVMGMDGTPARTPAWAEAITGLPADTIIALARRYAQLKPVALIPGLSIQRSFGGEETTRLAIALQTITGNLGRPGGSTGATAWGRISWPRLAHLPVPTPQQSASVPSVEWPDAVIGGRAAGYPSDIHAIYNVGGNYLVQGSDLHKSIRAFEKVDLAVCHDWFLTPTARYCDIVLPATMPLEREDAMNSTGNYILYSQQAVEPAPGTRDDYWIFAQLAERMGIGERYTEGRTPAQWLEYCLERSDVQDIVAFKRTGLFMGAEHKRTGLSDFIADPQAHPLHTPSGLIELSSERYARTGYDATPEVRMHAPDPAHPLNLITPVSRYRTHSQGSNVPWFREHEAGGLWINPQDAAARNIEPDQMVLVYNDHGQVRIKPRITSDIKPGVVCLLHGVWPEFAADGVEVAGSANTLSSTEGTQPSHGPTTHTIAVQVKRADEQINEGAQ